MPVTLADLASGDLHVLLGFETYHLGAKSWTADQFSATVALDGCTDTQAVQFLRTLVTDCETGQIVSTVDTTLDGDPYTVTGTVGQCQPAPSGVDSTAEDCQGFILCDTPDGGQPHTFLRTVCRDASGLVVSVADTELDATTPYAAAGMVGVCGTVEDESPGEPCRNSSALLLCDVPQDGQPTPTVTDTDPTPYNPDPSSKPVTGAQALWDGGTLTLPALTAAQPGSAGAVNTMAATVTGARPACDDGTATVTASVNVTLTGPDNGCGPVGHLRLFNGTTMVALDAVPNNAPVGWSQTLTVTATVPAEDVAAGSVAAVIALDGFDGGASCTPSPTETGWDLTGFTTSVEYAQDSCVQQVLASVVTDCETGTVESVAYSTLGGDPYTVTGEVAQCASTGAAPAVPCGDTELAQLCDLVYSPQAPIPTPADTFTLTGNVVNDGGGALWFAQANQVANGVAALTVGGLLPAVMYEFRFASAFVGSGGSAPANNNAIYLLEILDGTNVIATRTRDVSNGSTAFPGSVLAEDLPPLAFIAPTTGSVTIRFTDQSTGGAVNDRDLLIMPFEVRTAALTVTSTPFLRAFTFDCNGLVTGTQDLTLDGWGLHGAGHRGLLRRLRGRGRLGDSGAAGRGGRGTLRHRG